MKRYLFDLDPPKAERQRADKFVKGALVEQLRSIITSESSLEDFIKSLQRESAATQLSTCTNQKLREPLSLTATHVIDSLCGPQSGDLTTSTADGSPAGRRGPALSLCPTRSALGGRKRGHTYRGAPYPRADLLIYSG